MRIYLISHAHTEQVSAVAAENWKLSARGEQQASELAKAPIWHEVSRVVVSSELKTWLTIAEVATLRHLPVWVDSRFDEVRRSGWVEDYATQVNNLFAYPDESIAGWERASDTQRRAFTALEDVQARFAGETVAIVGHGLCLSLLRAKLLDQERVDFSTWQRLAFGSYACFAGQPLTVIQDFKLGEAGVR